MTSRISLALLLCTTFAAACGSDPVAPGADGGFADAAEIPPDGGVRALCPMLQAPQCDKAETCGAPIAPPNDCAGCRPHYASTCSFGACVTPDNPVALLNVYADITQVRGSIRSFVVTGVAAETAGGLPLTCMDLINADATARVSIDDPCVSILDSRTYDLGELNPTGEVYPVILSRFPTSAAALILVQVFAGNRGNGALIGHTCAPLQAGMAPVNNRIDLDGRTITRL